MKKIAKLLSCALILGSSLLAVSCGEEFIKEVRRDAMSSGWLDEPEGLASMAKSLYLDLNYFFANESSYCFTNYGTDEFMVAGDNSNEMWNTYDSRLGSRVQPRVNSNTQDNSTYWDHLYSWNARANRVIAGADILEGSPLRDETLGTAYFIRGFNYLFLTIQYGDVPLIVDVIDGPQREFPRVKQEEVYKQVISDLEKAHELLTSNASEAAPGNKITKYAAAHYLAQAHLWRASEINNSWNGSYRNSDLDAVIKYADEVIAAHPLAKDYNDLFNNFTTYDSSITETNSEIVLSSGNSDSSVDNRKSNWGLALFTAWYQSFPLMKRDLAGAREYQRMKTTPKYAYFLYDLENDSRFWKSFKTTYAVNNAGGGKITVQGTDYAANEYFPSNDGEYMSAMYIINRQDYGQKYFKSEVNVAKAPTSSSYTRQDYRTGKYIPTIMALYIYDDQTGEVVGTSMTPDYNTLLAPLCKYLDGAVNANNRGDGFRDGLFARSAEDYFFKAEALIRKGSIDQGLAVLQPLRERAQYKAGEKRDAYVDGGNAYHYNSYKSSLRGFEANCAFYPMNSYYYSIGLDKRETLDGTPSTLPAVTSGNYPKEDVAIMQTLGCTSDFDKAMCYLLNEKSREMYGEYKRWMDLARTKTLESRINAFNDQASANPMTDVTGRSQDMSGVTYDCQFSGMFRANQHYYRPIPQGYLDDIFVDGKPLTADQKKAMQNPGY